MVKKILLLIQYATLALLAVSFLGACTPKKMSPASDTLAQQEVTTVADANSDDDEDDGAWEGDGDEPVSSANPTDRLAQHYSRSNSSATGSTGELLQKARTALGTPYVRGGTNKGGFDCSGFVQWSYNSVGIQLPRTAREQSQVGKTIRRVDDMQAGDIVAFKHPKRGYHTGIYVGDGKFIHSPRKRNVVRINSLDDPYFNKTFLSARRLNVSNEGDIEAAEQMLVAYAKQPPSPKATSSRSASKKKQAKSSRSAIASKKSTEKIVALNTTKRTTTSAKKEKATATKNTSKKTATSRTMDSKAKSSTKKSASTVNSKTKAKNSTKNVDKTSEKPTNKAATKTKATTAGQKTAKAPTKPAAKSTKASTTTSKKTSR